MKTHLSAAILIVCSTAILASCSYLSANSREAHAMAQSFWDQHVKKCGDLWVQGTALGYFQIRNFSYDLNELEVTSTDKLNGYEWKGKTEMHAEASRLYQFGRWYDWSNGAPTETGLRQGTLIVKKNGKWGYEAGLLPSGYLSTIRGSNIACEQVSN